MYTKRIILLLIGCLHYFMVQAQTIANDSVANVESLNLYYAQNWSGLLSYGKSAIKSGTDFPLLRMRIGYASLLLGKYSESLKHYSKTYHRDKQNTIALYYTYLNNLYLNNMTSTRYYAGKMSRESRSAEKLKRYKLAAINTGYTYKYPDSEFRGLGTYWNAAANVQLGYRLELQQMAGFFHQTISEPSLQYVNDNEHIVIDQKEYYGKLIWALSGKLSLLGGYHYIFNSFNNYTYNNHLGFGGIKYSLPYFHLQLMGHKGTISDSSYQQVDATISTYPLGSTKLYTITRGSYGEQFTLTQIVGINILKNTWLEGNTTIGRYSKLLENDGLYLFNDIDKKCIKVGGTIYILMAKQLLLSLNYIYEQKLRFGTSDTYFNEHSVTIGLSWNL